MNVEPIIIPLAGLRDAVAERKAAGWRFAAASCVLNPEGGFDLYYHLDKDLELIHLKTFAPAGETVPSLSAQFFCALLYENEMKDQFGLEFEGLALDFNGKLYLEDDQTEPPMLKAGLSVLRLSKESKLAKTQSGQEG